ncbi:hypothetical protein [Microvirga yunnanensis]|uniref:hypothetical protein n=1 Tax=Microvirga yunnanensis TaxID=2953740 RepID=UPI0021C9B6C8|nr:hypothetical protein [Microvirga sp. HBU65207]
MNTVAPGGAKPSSKSSRRGQWLVKHEFIYGGKTANGLRDLAVLSGLPITTVRYYQKDMDPKIDVKPLLDRLVAERMSKLANPAIGEDGQSKQLIFGGAIYPSKKALADHVSKTFGLNMKGVQKQFWLVAEGTDVTEDLTSWIKNMLGNDEVAVVSETYGINKETVRGWRDRGLDLHKEARRFQKPPKVLQGAKRQENKNWNDPRVYDEFLNSLRQVESLGNLDLTGAKIFYRDGERNLRVRGLHCRVCQTDLNAEPQVSKLKKGQQPCRTCSKVGPSGPQYERTIERLQNTITDLGLPLDAAEAILIRADELSRKGPEKYVRGLRCACCRSELKATAWTSIVRGSLPCPECAKKKKLAFAEERVREVHGDDIVVEAYGGTLSSKSTFRCTDAGCGNKWTSAVNLVIGNGSQAPTRCQACNTKWRCEEAIAYQLDQEGVQYQRQYPVPVRLHGSGGLVSTVGYADFLLPELKRVIEYDGIQHYDRTAHFAIKDRKSFESRRALDEAKVAALAEAGILVCRIPHWCDDMLAEVKAILNGSPTYPGMPADAERRRDELGISSRTRERRSGRGRR